GRGTLFQLWRRDASWLQAPERDREHSFRLQLTDLNVGTVDRLPTSLRSGVIERERLMRYLSSFEFG
ncbi:MULTISPECIES: hypothetical protein, partial [unclassified Pseudomonas]|uniref:hypothetical protein n=1 Tax=unclassified Pseudomonas TaxID=196821 RepID=UPI001C4983F9